MMKKINDKKAGILTWHYYSNFGSRLQSYALQCVLLDLGYEPYIINYQNPKYSNVNWITPIKNYFKYFLNSCFGKLAAFNGLFDFCDYMFERKYLNQTRLVMNRDELRKLTDDFPIIVYGSDQIWAPNVFNDIYLGAGVNSVKVSYAASIGLPRIPNELQGTYRQLLGCFKSISVREEMGRKILQDVCRIESTVVLDPTLLLSVEQYRKIEKKPTKCKSDSFIFCYFLNNNNEYYKKIRKYINDSSADVYGVSLNRDDYTWMTDLSGIGPREFIWLIDHAQHVFTDSYHGTIFSLLFHKNFHTFERFAADDPVNQNSRIYQLDKWFSIGNKIMQLDANNISDMYYDYKLFEKRLEQYRTASLTYLREALIKC